MASSSLQSAGDLGGPGGSINNGLSLAGLAIVAGAFLLAALVGLAIWKKLK
jgi:hypothetical protein